MQVEFCEFPDDVLYDLENNVWIRVENTNCISLGITSVYASLAGKLKQIKFKPVGSLLVKEQSVATMESVRYFGTVKTPISGTLIEINLKLLSHPKFANDFPYLQGWFARILPNALEKELSKLHSAANSQETFKSQIRELRIRCFKAYPDYDMWEIGVECAAVLLRLSELMDLCTIGEVIHLVSDDPTADIEMVRWSDQTGQEILETRQEGNLVHFIIRKVKE
jgi:glycine cleavage system H lipoate-binding protein/TusA-related sulfurtransferase